MKLNESEADGAPANTSPDQDNDNPNNCNGDDNVNAIVDDDLEMVDRCERGNHHGDCIVVDCLEGECCIKCNSGSGKVLVCSENGCPIAFHEACLTWKPDFDDKGKFYCPYCLFKQEGHRFKELRVKSISARKELSDFICLRRDGGSEEKREGKKPRSEENSDEQTAHGFDNVENGERIEEVEKHERVNLEGASVSETTKKTSSGDCGKGLNNDDKEASHHNPNETQGVESNNKEKSDEGSLSGADGFENVGNDEKMEEDIENSSETEDYSPDLVSKTLVAGKKHDQQTADKAQPPQVISTDNSLFQPSTSAKNMNMNMNPEGKIVTAKISAGNQNSSEQLNIPIMGGIEKRRRLNWTAEEDVLKTSVSAMAKKASAGDCQNVLNYDDKETSHQNPDETQGVELMNNEKYDQGSNPGDDGSMNKEKSKEGSISGADGFENAGNGERMEGKKLDEETADKAQPPKVVSKDKSSFQPSSNAKNTNMNRKGKTVRVKISAGRRKSSEQPTVPITGDTEKRRRLNWTAEEEDMLKDLVQEFSMKVNKNVPWSKILEQGRSVFHSTRKPADLKDKWKNIVAKEISKG